MVSRYNRDFAQWVTTTPDVTTGLVVPSSRWFSYQIPADYLYGHSPSNPDFRYLTSASSWQTADIRPFGGAGTTAFNTREGNNFFRTLSSIAPLFDGQRALGNSPVESLIPATSDPFIYREEMALVEQWRPYLVVPYEWYDGLGLEPAFQTALVEMIARLQLAPSRLLATTNGGQVRVSWQPPYVGAAATLYAARSRQQSRRRKHRDDGNGIARDHPRCLRSSRHILFARARTSGVRSIGAVERVRA